MALVIIRKVNFSFSKLLILDTNVLYKNYKYTLNILGTF